MIGILESIINFIKQLPGFLVVYIYTTLITFIVALGVTYAIGRMLNIAHTDKTKNAIAIFFMILSSTISMLLVKYTNILVNIISKGFDSLFAESNIFHTIYYLSESFLVFFITIILYVLFAFRLYDRIDNLLDKKFPDDKPEPKKVKTGKFKKK